MKPKLIVVRGVNNCGKTTAIKLAFDELRKSASKIVRHVPLHHKEVRGAIIEIDGIKVGIISLGDVDYILEEWITFLIEQGCQVIVCACRSRGGTVEYLNGLEVETHFIEKWRVPGDERELANRKKAKSVVVAVNEAIVQAA